MVHPFCQEKKSLTTFKKKVMKLVLFDIDGTLSDTTAVDDKCFIAAFRDCFDIDIHGQDWSTINNVTDWGITEELFALHKKRSISAKEFQAMKATHCRYIKEESQKDIDQYGEIPGASSFFYTLSERSDIGIGLATGAWRDSAQTKLECIGIQPDQFAFSNSDHHKSREAITENVIFQILKQQTYSPESIYYFGDGLWDYKTCKNLGIHFIGVDRHRNGRLQKAGAEHIIQDYKNVEHILNLLDLKKEKA